MNKFLRDVSFILFLLILSNRLYSQEKELITTEKAKTKLSYENVLWLRPDVGLIGANYVTDWLDQSGNNVSLIKEGKSGAYPQIYETINFYSVPTFYPSGGLPLFYNTNLDISAKSYPELTIYTVFKPKVDNAGYVFGEVNSAYDKGDRALYDLNDTNHNNSITTGDDVINDISNFDVDKPAITTIIFNEDIVDGSSIFINGLKTHTFTSNHDGDGKTSSLLDIGAMGYSNYSFKGEIAELIMFKGVPTPKEKQYIESILAVKYGLTLNGTNYSTEVIEGSLILRDGLEVWNYNSQWRYRNNVASLGRDDQLQINKKQSTSISSEDPLIIGLGNITDKNATNLNEFSMDESFLTWGNNGLDGTLLFPGSPLCSKSLQLKRIWGIVELDDLYDFKNRIGTVKISIPKAYLDALLPNQNHQKVLKVANNRLFLSGLELLPLSEEMINGVESYTVNYDFKGTKVFTFAEQGGVYWDGETSSWIGGTMPDGSPGSEYTDSYEMVTVDSKGTNNHPTLNHNVKVGCLWIKEGAVLKIANDNSLTIHEDLKIDGNLQLLGSSQLIQTHDGDRMVSGKGHILINQQGTSGNMYMFNYWTSPVRNINSGAFQIHEVMRNGNDFTSNTNLIPQKFNFISSYNGTQNASPVELSNRWLYSYINGTTGRDWNSINPSQDYLNPGQGFSLKGPQGETPQSYTFYGTPNDGNISYTVTPNTVSLLGNPYPSAIDAYKFLTDNTQSIETLYFWSHAWNVDNHVKSPYSGGYGYMNASVSVKATIPSTDASMYSEPKRYIPVAQGFFVESTILGGEVKFENSQRIFKKEIDDGGDDSIFMKGNKNNLSILKIGFEYINDYEVKLHRQIAISFKEGNTFDKEVGFDSEVYDIDTSDIYINFQINENKYIIAGVQSITEDLEVPLVVVAGYSGKFKFNIDDKKNIQEEIFLIDKQNNKKYNLNNPIELNILKGTHKNRFYISFDSNVLDIDDLTYNDELKVFFNKDNQTMNIVKKVNTNILNIEVFNLLGQEDKEVIFKTENNLNDGVFNVKKKGLFIVKVKTTNKTHTYKLLF